MPLFLSVKQIYVLKLSYFHVNLNSLLFLLSCKQKEQTEAAKELEQSIHLVKAPIALKEDQSLTLPKIRVTVSQSQAENAQMDE